MADERKQMEYRRHELVAMLQGLRYRGRAWDGDRKQVAELEGKDIEDVLQQLRHRVDLLIAERETRGPTPADYVRAFRKILNRLSESQLRMLRAHYQAPGQVLTETQLAEAAPYDSGYSTANLHYGNVGKWLYEESLPITLPLDERRKKPIYTFALADGAGHGDEGGHFMWKMRPEVAAALEELGLHK